MTLAKIVVSGTVTKSPEKRFTQNNVAITSFVMNINPQDETVVRVMALGALAERVAETVSMGDAVIVDGRPQIEAVKSASGKDKRVVEINASAVEKLGADSSASSARPQAARSENIVQFATEDLTDEPIDEDEIPF